MAKSGEANDVDEMASGDEGGEPERSECRGGRLGFEARL